MNENNLQPMELQKIERCSDFRQFDTAGNHWIACGFADNQIVVRELSFSTIEPLLDSSLTTPVAVYSDQLAPLAYYIPKSIPQREFSAFFKSTAVEQAANVFALQKKQISELSANGSQLFMYSLSDKKMYKLNSVQASTIVDKGNTDGTALAALTKDRTFISGFKHKTLKGLPMDEMFSSVIAFANKKTNWSDGIVGGVAIAAIGHEILYGDGIDSVVDGGLFDLLG